MDYNLNETAIKLAFKSQLISQNGSSPDPRVDPQALLTRPLRPAHLRVLRWRR